MVIKERHIRRKWLKLKIKCKGKRKQELMRRWKEQKTEEGRSGRGEERSS